MAVVFPGLSLGGGGGGPVWTEEITVFILAPTWRSPHPGGLSLPLSSSGP